MENHKQLAIITGGSDGIGKAIAAGFLENNIPVHLLARTQSKLDDTKEELDDKYPNVGVTVQSADATKKGQIESIIDEIIETVDELFWINNAGAFRLYNEETFHTDLPYVMSFNFASPNKYNLKLIGAVRGTDKKLHLISNLSQIIYRSLEGNEIYKSTKLAFQQATYALEEVESNPNISYLYLYPGPIATDQILDKIKNDGFVPSDPVAPTDAVGNIIGSYLKKELPTNDVMIGNFQNNIEEVGLKKEDIKGITRVYMSKEGKVVDTQRMDPDFDYKTLLQ